MGKQMLFFCGVITVIAEHLQLITDRTEKKCRKKNSDQRLGKGINPQIPYHLGRKPLDPVGGTKAYQKEPAVSHKKRGNKDFLSKPLRR